MNALQDSPVLTPLEILKTHLHPEDWINPTPQPWYDLVVIGAGPAGLVTAAGAAGLGAKVALVEKHLMGGDCLNVGCIPSKCLIASARSRAHFDQSLSLGISAHSPQVNFRAVMERLHRIQADLSHHDSAQRFQSLGVDVFFGHGTFTSPQEVTVNQHTLRFRKAVIATGTRAAIPPIPGLDTVGYLTHATLFSFLFSLKACPPHLGVIGGGPVGCELAQALQRLGAQVTLLHHHPRLLNREDGEAAAIIQHSLESDGVNVLLNAQVEQVQGEANPFMGKKVLYYRQGTQSHHLTVDALLISTGRLPNVENLNLAAAGVKYSTQGITVNDYLQTTNPKIYAAGDVCLAQRFTHAADGAARLVLKNALFSPWGLGRSRWSQVVVPHCLYTSPELAQVGLTAAEAAAQGIALRTFEIPLSQVDRAITVGTISETALGTISGTTAGFAKIHVRQGSDQILGATVVAEQAGELISEITLAMVHRIGLGSLANVLHPYPTHSEIIRKAADAYRRTLLTPRTLGLLKALMRWG